MGWFKFSRHFCSHNLPLVLPAGRGWSAVFLQSITFLIEFVLFCAAKFNFIIQKERSQIPPKSQRWISAHFKKIKLCKQYIRISINHKWIWIPNILLKCWIKSRKKGKFSSHFNRFASTVRWWAKTCERVKITWISRDDENGNALTSDLPIEMRNWLYGHAPSKKDKFELWITSFACYFKNYEKSQNICFMEQFKGKFFFYTWYTFYWMIKQIFMETLHTQNFLPNLSLQMWGNSRLF